MSRNSSFTIYGDCAHQLWDFFGVSFFQSSILQSFLHVVFKVAKNWSHLLPRVSTFSTTQCAGNVACPRHNVQYLIIKVPCTYMLPYLRMQSSSHMAPTFWVIRMLFQTLIGLLCCSIFGVSMFWFFSEVNYLGKTYFPVFNCLNLCLICSF